MVGLILALAGCGSSPDVAAPEVRGAVPGVPRPTSSSAEPGLPAATVLHACDPPRLLSGRITALHGDSRGLWIGTASGGAAHRESTGALHTYTTWDGLPDNEVRSFHALSDGRLWVGTRTGVALLMPDQHRFRGWTFPQLDQRMSEEARVVHHSADGRLWVFRPGVLLALRPDSAGVGQLVPAGVGEVGVVVERRDGTLLVGADVGVLEIDGAGGVRTLLSSERPIRALLETDEGLWVGTDRQLLRLGPGSDATAEEVLDSGVSALVADDAGAVWVAGRGGLSRVEPGAREATPVQADGELWSGLLLDLGITDEGRLWVAGDRGLGWLDVGTEQAVQVSESPAEAIEVTRDQGVWVVTAAGLVEVGRPEVLALEVADGLRSDRINALASSADGRLLWVASDEGLARLEPSGAVRSWGRAEGLPGDRVFAVISDGQAAWAGTEGGLASEWWEAGIPRVGRTLTPGAAVFAVALDVDDQVWVGTNAGAFAFRLDGPEGPRLGPRLVRDGRVTALQALDNGQVWAGGAGVLEARRPGGRTGAWKSLLPGAEGEGASVAVVNAMASRGDTLWLGTDQGVVRVRTTGNPVAELLAEGRAVSALVDDGALWVASGQAVARLDDAAMAQVTKNRTPGASSAVYRLEKREEGSEVDGRSAVRTLARAQQATWVGGDRGLSRLVVGGPTEAGTGSRVVLHALAETPPVVAPLAGGLMMSRPAGLCYLPGGADAGAPVLLELDPPGQAVTAIARGPGESAWVGTTLGGLALRDPVGRLTRALDLLPSQDVRALASSEDGSTVWVATSGGVTRVRAPTAAGGALVAERTLLAPQLTGRVDALAASPGGGVVMAVAPRDERLRPGEDRDPGPRVVLVPGDLGPLRTVALPEGAGEVRALAVGDDAVWIGTSTGLYALATGEPTDAAASGAGGPLRVEYVGGVSSLAVDGEGMVWIGTDKAMLQVVDSRSGLVHARLEPVPASGAREVRGLWLQGSDTLLVQVDGTLARVDGLDTWRAAQIPDQGIGWIKTFIYAVVLGAPLVAATVLLMLQRHPMVLRLRSDPLLLTELPLAHIPVAIRRLRAAQALDEVWAHLKLPPARLAQVESLAAPVEIRTLRILADLLGMQGAWNAPVRAYPGGLSALVVWLGSPAPLRGQGLPLLLLDPEVAGPLDPGVLQSSLRQALHDTRRRFELPFLLVCPSASLARELVTESQGALIIGEKELCELMFARSPNRTLAGLLHTRGLLLLSPYTTAGEVKDLEMFYGRTRLLRELLTRPRLRSILVGPRRVGKTSLLKKLAAQVPSFRPDLEVIYLDLLGVSSHARAFRQLAKTLGVSEEEQEGVSRDPESMAELLRRHLGLVGRQGVLLIDEADGLVEADSALGFPMLKKLRTMQAEEVCSFVLTGYWSLYVRALDHGSPLYNFADVEILGPLEPEAALELAVRPMERLGVRYAEADLPDEVVACTGGYPNLVQGLCAELLRALGQDEPLTINRGHLALAQDRLRADLVRSFQLNATRAGQILVYELMGMDSFDASQAHESLARLTGRDVPLRITEALLERLVLQGVLIRERTRFRWAIPLLRDTLQELTGVVYRRDTLLRELPEDPEQWIDAVIHQR